MIDRFFEKYVDPHKITTKVQDLLYRFKCRNFGHEFENAGDDCVRCCLCGRLYYKIAGEEVTKNDNS